MLKVYGFDSIGISNEILVGALMCVPPFQNSSPRVTRHSSRTFFLSKSRKIQTEGERDCIMKMMNNHRPSLPKLIAQKSKCATWIIHWQPVHQINKGMRRNRRRLNDGVCLCLTRSNKSIEERREFLFTDVHLLSFSLNPSISDASDRVTSSSFDMSRFGSSQFPWWWPLVNVSW